MRKVIFRQYCKSNSRIISFIVNDDVVAQGSRKYHDTVGGEGYTFIEDFFQEICPVDARTTIKDIFQADFKALPVETQNLVPKLVSEFVRITRNRNSNMCV